MQIELFEFKRNMFFQKYKVDNCMYCLKTVVALMSCRLICRTPGIFLLLNWIDFVFFRNGVSFVSYWLALSQ